MRAWARLVLVLIAVFASFGLAGCSIDELKDTMSFATEKSEGGHEGKLSGGFPEVAVGRPPEKNFGRGGKQGVKEKGQCGEQTATAANG